MDDSDNIEKPKAALGDAAHTGLKAALSAIPIVGGPAAEIFSAVVIPPLSKRREEWLESIVERLKRLEREVEGFKIEELSQNDVFITAVMHASQIAIRNHREEKLEALRNAVLNAALPNPPNEDLQLMFLNFIDTLTSWHLRVLKFFEDPRGWGQKYNISYPRDMGSLANALVHAFPELRDQREFYELIARDLFQKGLLMNMESLHVAMSEQGIFASRVTEMGKMFIAFIESPKLA